MCKSSGVPALQKVLQEPWELLLMLALHLYHKGAAVTCPAEAAVSFSRAWKVSVLCTTAATAAWATQQHGK